MFLCSLRFALLFLAVRASSFALSVLLPEQPRTGKSPPRSLVCALRLSAIGAALAFSGENCLFASAALWLCALGVGFDLFVSLRFALLIKEEKPYTVPLASRKTRSKP